MAGVTRSSKDLWVLISGTSLLKSKELVGTELQENAERIKNGILYYRKPSSTSLECLRRQNIQGAQLEFVQRLSKLLNVDENQCYELFCSFLLYEYRGTQHNLKAVFSNERHMQSMLLEIWNFYYNERLYNILCLKHILCYVQDSSHPYKELYVGFLETISKSCSMAENIIAQLEELITAEPPNKDYHSQIMTEALLYQWAAFNIKEQSELLQVLLLYYKDSDPKPEDIIKLISLFQKHSFGMRQSYRQYLSESSQGQVNLIGYLEVLVIVESLELEWLCMCQLEGEGSHFISGNSGVFDRFDEIFCNFGNYVQHGPLLLAWLLVKVCSGKHSGAKQLGKSALQLDAFNYLASALNCTVLRGIGIIPNLAHSIMYGLLSGLLTHFEINTLGRIQPLCQLAECMLKYTNIAEDFWKKGLENGVGIIVKMSVDMFPLEFGPILRLCSALAQAGEDSCQKVTSFFGKLPGYTEYLENNINVVATGTPSIWQLVKEKAPYGTETFIIPSGTIGIMLTDLPNVERKDYSVIQWQKSVNGWQICLCEIHNKLQEVSLGAGYVTDQSISCIMDIAQLTYSALQSDPSARFKLMHIANEFFVILQRYSVLPSPPVELLARTLDVIRSLSKYNPEEMWQRFLSISFLPYMTETCQYIPSAASSLYTSAGILGQLVAASECVTGRYSLLLSFLKFLESAVETSQKHIEEENIFLACLIYILQDVFPSFHKWHYTQSGVKENIGQLCLSIFHKILSLSHEKGKPKLSRVQGVCTYSLLHSASSQALLRIVCTGETAVQQAIQAPDNMFGGVGHELVALVHLSLSVLNRLLLLKHRSVDEKEKISSISPLEQVIFSHTHSQPHVALIVAYYAFQRYSPRLATLAVQLLKRFAKEFPMSLLACLGTEADAICDHFLLRLSSVTEDIRLKVAIIEFLTVCISHQPGLIERFINIPIDEKSDKERRLNSCLHSLLEILKDQKEKASYCPEELHCAAVEFFHALWTKHQLLAEDRLKQDENFWDLLCEPLFTKENSYSRVTAYIIRTLALEIYHTYTFKDRKLDEKAGEVLKKLVTSNLADLSKFIHHHLYPTMEVEMNESLSILEMSVISDASQDKHILLKCWKDFLLVGAKFFQGDLAISRSDQIAIMEDILQSLKLQVENHDEIESQKQTPLLMLLAELCLLLLQKFECKSFPVWKKWLPLISGLLDSVAVNVDSVHPKLQMTMVCIASSTLQILSECTTKNDLPSFEWVSSVCILLRQSALHVQTELLKGKSSQPNLRLCVLTICLLKDLINHPLTSDTCISDIQKHAVLDTLGSLLLLTVELCRGIDLAHAILTFFLSPSSIKKFSEMLHGGGFMPQLCLLLSNTYTAKKNQVVDISQNASKTNIVWPDVYNITMRLVAQLLQTVKHSFLQHAINFVGVHSERLSFSLQCVRQAPQYLILEETIMTCTLVYQMSFYWKQWHLHHPASLNLLMTGIGEACHAAVAFLSRPTMLQHLLEHSSTCADEQQSFLELSYSHRYKRLSSAEEVEKPSPQFIQVQQRLLKILSLTLSTMHNISPSLYKVIFDKNLDLGKWSLLLPINFSLPSIEHEGHLNFGTVMSCINICLRALTKNEPPLLPEHSLAEVSCPEEKHLLIYILEISLSFLLSQAVLYLFHPSIMPHDKQLIRRELGAELSSVTLTMNRYLRKSPLSPASSLITQGQGHSQTSIFDRPLIRLLGPLVDKLFK